MPLVQEDLESDMDSRFNYVSFFILTEKYISSYAHYTILYLVVLCTFLGYFLVYVGGDSFS